MCRKTKANLVYNWTGWHLSLNDFTSKHWRTRDREKKNFSKIILNQHVQYSNIRIGKYKIECEYNSRLDPSNVMAVIKFLEDFLQKHGNIKDDSKKYCRGIHITPNESLRQKEYLIRVIEL